MTVPCGHWTCRCCWTLLDLLRLETDVAQWRAVAGIAVPEIGRRTVLGDTEAAHQLASALVAETADTGRAILREAARAAIETLAAGPLVRHVVLHLGKVDEANVRLLARLCHTIGPSLVRPLAEALAIEQNSRAIRRLREMLLGFGAAGRQSVEQLKNSSNPSVRRTAIDLLRVFGGHEALPELASMLDDADPQVQRESIRAIVQIGTDEAFAVLEPPLRAAASRDTVVQELIALREDKAIPLLCYVLNHTRPRGKLAQAHAEIVEALGGLSAHPESTRTLRHVLFDGDWWAPFRTAALRKAAATALRRIGTPDTITTLQEAASSGPRAVRAIARTQLTLASRRQPPTEARAAAEAGDAQEQS
jgi:HEAT repeat protein